MNEKEILKFEEYLSTIVNTRLFYNTIEEYESKLDNHSLHNNGVKRCINTPQKLRAAFRDFQIETLKLTREQLSLTDLLEDYKAAWLFYREHLSRRRNPSSYVRDLINYYYPPYKSDGLSNVKLDIFDEIVQNNINVPMLILMLLKVLPGYDSKDGNVYNISRSFETVIHLLEDYTHDNKLFSIFPTIVQAKDEQHQSRLTLIYHTTKILDLYESFLDSNGYYEQSTLMKQNSVDLDLDGYWNQCSGTLNYTIFWKIEHAMNDGTYFVTYWHKDGNNILTGIKYTMYLSETTDHKLNAYMIHPLAIMHRIKGMPYTDRDNVWYEAEMPQGIRPNEIPFERLMNSYVWPRTLNITRVTDMSIIETYDKWFNICDISQKYKELDYYFIPNLYAATLDYLYIPTHDDNTYYKIPRESYPGLENIQLGDLAGTMTMDNKEYIVFDDLLLYIETTESELNKYNIEIVDSIR